MPTKNSKGRGKKTARTSRAATKGRSASMKSSRGKSTRAGKKGSRSSSM